MAKNDKQDVSKKTSYIILAVSVVIVVAIIVGIILLVNNSDKDSSAATATSSTEKEVEDKTEVKDDEADSGNSTTSSSSESLNTQVTVAEPVDGVEPTRESTLTDEDSRLQLQANFDQYIENKEYDKALDLLTNEFNNSTYSGARLATYENYVTYYEAQEQYENSLNYQLDYMETKDGVENVRSSSVHYQLMLECLEHITSTDARIDQIKAAVARWDEVLALYNSGDYDATLAKLTELKNSGVNCVILYYYLSMVYNKQGDYANEIATYVEFIDSKSDYNQLEGDLVYSFKEHLSVYYTNSEMDDYMEPYSDRSDLFLSTITGVEISEEEIRNSQIDIE